MTNNEFGEAINDVIHATLNVYMEAGFLLRDLRTQLEGKMKVLPLKSISKGDEALKVLRGWRGLLARPELYQSRRGKGSKRIVIDDDDADSPKDEPRMLRIPAGGDLLFAKLVLHDFPQRIDPHFVGGILSDAATDGNTPTEPAQVFEFKTQYARRILEDMTLDVWQDGGRLVPTQAKVHTGAGTRKLRGVVLPSFAFSSNRSRFSGNCWS